MESARRRPEVGVTVSSMTTDAPPWWACTRVGIVAGKGGVGSSTVAAAWALAAARQGADVLVVSVDGRPGVGPLLGGGELDSTDRTLCRIDGGGRVRGRTIPAHQAFADYLEIKGIGAVVRRAAAAASLPMIAAATPGLEHLMVLARIKELDRDRTADLIVVDAPAAGRASAFLRASLAVSELVTAGPVREQADEVVAMLHDPDRCRVMVVTLPEGEDPDTFVRGHGPRALEAQLGAAIDVFERKLQILQRGGWLSDLRRKRVALDRLLPTIRAASDSITRGLYLAQASEAVGVGQDVLERELRQGSTRGPARGTQEQKGATPQPAVRTTERRKSFSAAGNSSERNSSERRANGQLWHWGQ